MAATSDVLSTAEKLRMDRQLHALGEEMVVRMKAARVLISGLGGLGVEIAKNVALAGCKQLVLHDTVAASHLDLSTHFYLSEEHIGHNRAVVSAEKVGELNPFCPVTSHTDDLWAKSDEELSAFLKGFTCVLLTEAPRAVQLRVNGLCHALNVPFMTADVRGVFCAAFVDVGQHFEVWDKDGEAPHEVLIGGVSRQANATVTCLQFHKSPFSAGDFVTFREVRGMEALNSGTYKILDNNYDAESKTGSFVIELDTSAFPEFVPGSGRAVQKKVNETVVHQTLASLLDNPGEKLLISDYAKFENPAQLHIGFSALHQFQENAGGALPRPWDQGDADKVIALAKDINARTQLVTAVNEDLIRQLANTAAGAICPLTGFLGGFLSQEVLKVISGKFTPLNQFYYLDLVEVVPKASEVSYTADTSRQAAQIICLGAAMCERLATARLFTVGAGAIGCELIKNYAMLSIATKEGGEIFITDDDRIELSNLNRQFLFRDKDLGSFKSSTAAQAARAMNPALRITPFERRVEKKSEDLFSNRFYSTLDCVVNALDNVQARQYVDARSVENQKALIDSGTLSSKGHVQVVVPFMTETYGSQSDPASQEVPFCTIKSFPHDISHCIQWARDLCFELQFATRPNQWNKLFSTPDPVATITAPDGAGYRPDVVCKMAANRPASIDDCIRRARIKWEKMFVHAPSDLLHAFPLEHKDKDGNLFWTSPKRPPHPLTWSSSDPLCITFVSAFANLLAFIYGLPPCRDEQHIAAVADSVTAPTWAPKRKEIETDESKAAPQEDTKKNKLDASAIRGFADQVRALLSAGPVAPLQVVDFEKDDDTNFHIDCIHATANLRARVYSIDEISRMDTKRIAGRILPALATTTACVSGWAMAQLLCIFAKGPIDSYKNLFLNLALPLFQLSEPGPTRKIGKEGSYYDTIWDQWSVHDPSMTVKQFLDYIQQKYSFTVGSIFLDGSMTLYLGFMHSTNTARLNKRIIDSLPEPPAADAEYLLLTLIPELDEEEEEEEEDEDEDQKQDGAIVRFYLH